MAKKHRIIFDKETWEEMVDLVQSAPGEVAWHSLVDRNGRDFHISGVLVYPQEASGAHVETDQAEYEKWLYSLDDDEFRRNRYQAHSHADMAPSPSSVDIEDQSRIARQVGKKDFYLFQIWNRRLDHWSMIVDGKKIVPWEEIETWVDGRCIDDWKGGQDEPEQE